MIGKKRRSDPVQDEGHCILRHEGMQGDSDDGACNTAKEVVCEVYFKKFRQECNRMRQKCLDVRRKSVKEQWGEVCFRSCHRCSRAKVHCLYMDT